MSNNKNLIKEINNQNSIVKQLDNIDSNIFINLISGLEKAKNIAQNYYIKYETEKYNLLKEEEPVI